MDKENNTNLANALNIKEQLLTCKECDWQGTIKEINWEMVETCMGNDKIEICPICGSFEIKHKR